MELGVFCLKEGVSQSTFYRWVRQLKNGIPKSMIAEEEARKKAESAEGAAFVPVSLKASPVEIELPNGGMVRLPLGVGQAVLVVLPTLKVGANRMIVIGIIDIQGASTVMRFHHR